MQPTTRDVKLFGLEKIFIVTQVHRLNFRSRSLKFTFFEANLVIISPKQKSSARLFGDKNWQKSKGRDTLELWKPGFSQGFQVLYLYISLHNCIVM